MLSFPLVRPGRPATRGKDPFRPQFECLEDRCLLAADFHTLPVIPAINQSMKSYLQGIFQKGQSLGQRPGVFAKVGDSNTFSPTFLDGLGGAPFDPTNPAYVGSNTDLAAVVDMFRQTSVEPTTHLNSFNHTSAAAYGGWTTTSLLTPGLRGVAPWLIGSATMTPLDAEIRQTEPAFALVMIGTCEVGNQNPGLFQSNLTLIVQDLLSQGVIPVLSTIPEDFLPFPGLAALTAQFNQIIANVAGNLNVPLWNLWVGLDQLPNEGIGPDGVHLSYSPAGADLLDNADLVFGMNYRNLTALEVLAKIVGVVENNGAPDTTPPPPSVPVAPFIETLYQDILQRPVDPGGLAMFSIELYQGVAPAVVIQQVWTSAEHRQIQIGRYYERFFGRPVDAAGLGWWQQQFSLGMNETQVQVAMLASTEYGQLHPGGPRFVEGVYGDVLGRLPGPSEGIYWLAQMQNAGLTRAGFANTVVQSTEAEATLIDHVYETFLGRSVDPGAVASGLELLAGDQGGQLMLVQNVLLSKEFLKRLG